MRLVQSGFPEEYRSLCKPLILTKIVVSMRAQLEETRILDNVPEDWPSKHLVQRLLNLSVDTQITEIAPDIQHAIAGLWSERILRETFETSNQDGNGRHDFDALKL